MAVTLAALEGGMGNALKVVLLHAFPFNKQMWKHQVAGLSAKAHVISVDLPGFGETPAEFPSKAGATSLKGYVDAITAFLGTRGITKAVFGGCSWGGYIIFELWSTNPSLVSGLLLFDTRMEPDTACAPENRKKTNRDFTRQWRENSLFGGTYGAVFVGREAVP